MNLVLHICMQVALLRSLNKCLKDLYAILMRILLVFKLAEKYRQLSLICFSNNPCEWPYLYSFTPEQFKGSGFLHLVKRGNWQDLSSPLYSINVFQGNDVAGWE